MFMSKKGMLKDPQPYKLGGDEPINVTNWQIEATMKDQQTYRKGEVLSPPKAYKLICHAILGSAYQSNSLLNTKKVFMAFLITMA